MKTLEISRLSLNNQAWWLGLQSKLPTGLALVLFGLLSWQAGVWLAQSLDEPALPTLPSLTTSQTVTPSNASVYSSMLWGRPEVKPVVTPKPEPVSQTLQPTRLNLKLLGVIGFGERSVAIIGRGRDTLVVSVGETIQPQVTLLEVGRDFIIVNHRGQREKLMMEDGAKGLVTPAEPEPEAASSGLSAADQQKLKGLSEELRQNPMRIGHYIGFRALQENGQWLGISIEPKNEPAMFNQLGFRAGDIVKAINGKTVAEMAQNPAIWNGFLQETRFNLQIERDGLLESIDVNLE